jgi:hypothetical protein
MLLVAAQDDGLDKLRSSASMYFGYSDKAKQVLRYYQENGIEVR